MTTEEMKQRYSVVVEYGYPLTPIGYSDNDNNWVFEIRGKARTAVSLKEAKQAIDRPPAPDKKTFKRIEVYYRRGYSATPVEAVVTSIAPSRRYHSGPEVWVTFSEKGVHKNREIASLSNVFARTPENREIINRIATERDLADSHNAEAGRLQSSLKAIELQSEDYD